MTSQYRGWVRIQSHIIEFALLWLNSKEEIINLVMQNVMSKHGKHKVQSKSNLLTIKVLYYWFLPCRRHRLWLGILRRLGFYWSCYYLVIRSLWHMMCPMWKYGRIITEKLRSEFILHTGQHLIIICLFILDPAYFTAI